MKLHSPRKDIMNKNYDEDYFERIDSKEKAYFLGYLFADGNNYVKKERSLYQVSLSLCECDVEIIEKMKKCLKYQYPIRYKRSYQNKYGSISKRQAKIVICSRKMSEDLTSLGCKPRKTNSLTFPDIDEIYKRDFIRGYFDGDGCFSFVNRNCLKFSMCGNVKFLKQVKHELEKHGIKLNFYKHSKVKNFGEISTAKRDNLLKINDLFYSENCFYLKRKYNKLLQYIKNVSV